MQGAGSSAGAAQPSTLRTLPFAQLRQNRYFYMYYDGFYAVAAALAIAEAGRTEKIGDGKIWVSDVERVIRVRTGELDDDAI